jgi:hypothetical protein
LTVNPALVTGAKPSAVNVNVAVGVVNAATAVTCGDETPLLKLIGDGTVGALVFGELPRLLVRVPLPAKLVTTLLQ